MRRFRSQVVRAFTLIELIVVVTLVIVVLGVAVPAFRAMLEGSERSLAENTLRVGVQVARDLALRGEGDAALVFIRDADGRTRLVPVVKAGEFDDYTFNAAAFGAGAYLRNKTNTVRRDVFAPAPLATPLLLPRGFSVSGYADPNSIDQCFRRCLDNPQPVDREGWYDAEAYSNRGVPGGALARLEGNWVLPETFLFEPDVQGPGVRSQASGDPSSRITGANVGRTPRQSFMIRFESGTGQLVRGSRPSLVLDPRASSLGRGLFTGSYRWMRANRAEDAKAWTSRVLSTRVLDAGGLEDVNFLYLQTLAIGNYSNDTVLAGPVARIALFRENELVSGVGASGVNRETNSLYRPAVEPEGDEPMDFGTATGVIRFDMNLFEGTFIRQADQVRIAINRWMQGDTNFIAAGGFDRSDVDGDGNVFGDAASGNLPADEARAKIYFVQPSTGELTEVLR